MKKPFFSIILSCCVLLACNSRPSASLPIAGTWRLVSGTTITRGVSSVTDYTKDISMIKIINNDHFAFLKHDLNSPKDSSNHFDAGGGSYTLSGDQYTEHLDYYSDRNWEGKTFQFTVSFSNDTLIQRGMEKLEKEGIDREIIERYVRAAK
ncbi:MAG: lipocalin-like domain-containing protein [Chitinophagaceae bacterium]|nr:lipocalin-like domain-containing protein [Chitinophagaceae bacterium]